MEKLLVLRLALKIQNENKCLNRENAYGLHAAEQKSMHFLIATVALQDFAHFLHCIYTIFSSSY